MTTEEEIDKAVDEMIEEIDSHVFASASEPRWVTKSFYTQIMHRCRTRLVAIAEEESSDDEEAFES
jgi:fructose-1-phosphate kinase PfkB-like protein